jgi:hypothetical protein
MSRVITPEAIISYPNLLEPRAMGNGKPKYGAAFVFTPEAQETPAFKAMEKALVDAMVGGFGKKAAAAVVQAVQAVKSGKAVGDEIKVGGIRWPIRYDGGAKGYPEGSCYVNARSERKPGVVSIFPGPDGKPARLTDDEIQDQVYPGSVVKASLDAYSYGPGDHGNKGVTFGLGNIQRIRDGERLDGATPAQDEFEADADAVADLSDLEDTLDGVEDAADDEGDEEGGDDLTELLG